jgi:hypothetical protein
MQMITTSNLLLRLFLPLLVFFSVVSSSEIDFSNITECARKDCFPYHSSTFGCPQLTKDCFCSALAPINCASKSCNGSDWYALEDWFATQCPNPPIVGFEGLPLCSRACLRKAIIPKYCQSTITRNCFCRLQNEFETLSPCIRDGCNVAADIATNMTQKYFSDTCIYRPTADGSGNPLSSNNDPNQQDEVVAAPTEDSPINRLALGVGLASGFVSIIVFAVAV